MNILDRIDAAQHYAAQLDRYLRRVNTEDPTEPFSDRASSGHIKRFDMGRDCRLIYGRVVDTIAYCHWYKVQPEGAKTVFPCCMLSSTSLTPFGVRDHNQIHPNARVFILLHPSSPYGVIIGVEPPHMFDARAALSDYISLSSRNGVQVDDVHRFPFQLPKQGTIVDWSAGRPADATGAGEKGWFAESGVGLFVDSAMAFLRADEHCGVWAFYRDALLRLAGHNLQIRSSGMEWECLDDQGEFNVRQGYTPYPWEQLGGLTPTTPLHRELSTKESQVTDPHYARLEPAADDQQPFHRVEHHYGYLGQGGRRAVAAPPVGPDLHRYSARSAAPGLFAEQISLTGQYSIQTSKGFRIVKRLLVPVPKLVARPESRTGDTPENYKAAGLAGDGAEHTVRSGVQTSGDDPAMNRAMGVLDTHAYDLNWEGLLPFSAHARDYYVPEESYLQNILGAPNIAKIPFERLAQGGRLPPPDPVKVAVDHRYREVDYYPSCSYFELADDGAALLADGYGSEMRMVGGDMVLAPPGDLILQPGRRIVIMAGDVEIRAARSMTLSTTDNDLRLSSGRHAYLAAEGGVLVESRSQGTSFEGWRDVVGDDVEPTGVVVKAAQSNVTTWSDSIYMRSGIGGAGGGIYIDSGKGEGRIVTNSLTWERYMSSSADHFGVGGAVQSSNIADASVLSIASRVDVIGEATFGEGVLASGWIRSATGHVSTALAAGHSDKVGELKDDVLDNARNILATAASSSAIAKETGESAYAEVFENSLYAAQQAGNDQTIQEAGFSFRTQTQYGTQSFRLYETRWQQLARIWESPTRFWAEKPVHKSGEATYPFPGRQKLTAEAAFVTQDLNLLSPDLGTALNRTDPKYQDPKHAEPQLHVTNEAYRLF